MERILVTGASGFVGKNLTGYLRKDRCTVESLRVRYGTIVPHLHAYAVIHLSAKAHDLRITNSPVDYYEANTKLSNEVFDRFLESEAKVFITLSSVKAIADSVEGLLAEEFTPDPHTHYGMSKLQAEQYIFSKPLPDNKRVYVLRPCMIHGPGNKGNLNLLYQLVKKGIPYPLAGFDNSRSFLSIENLCFVIRELIRGEDIAPGIYHVADDMPLSTNRVIEIISDAFHRRSRLWYINESIIRMIGKLGDVLPFPLNSEKLQKLTGNYVVSNRKLLVAIKKPLPVDSAEGLRRTIQSFIDSE